MSRAVTQTCLIFQSLLQTQLISFKVCYKDIDLCHTYASQFISQYSTAASVTISSCPELLFIDTHEITSGDYVIDNDLFIFRIVVTTQLGIAVRVVKMVNNNDNDNDK